MCKCVLLIFWAVVSENLTSKKALRGKRIWTVSTETDNIINIFIYETGGVKIMPFMSSPFVLIVFHQTFYSCWEQIRIFFVLLPQQVFHFLMVSKDFQVIYGSIYSHNKVVCESFVPCSWMKLYWSENWLWIKLRSFWTYWFCAELLHKLLRHQLLAMGKESIISSPNRIISPIMSLKE